MELVRNKNRRQPRKEWPSAANTSEGLTLPAAAGRAQSGATTKYEFAYAMRIATDEEATAPLSRVFIQTAPYDRPHNELRTDDPLWWPPILC